MIPVTRVTNVNLPHYQHVNYLCVGSEVNNRSTLNLLCKFTKNLIHNETFSIVICFGQE